MKTNYILYAFAFFLVTLSACQPLDNREEMTGNISVEDIQATVRVEQINGKNVNKVFFECSSPISCQWSNGVETHATSSGEMLMFLTGEQTVTLTGLCGDGSVVTKDFPVTVDELYYEVAPEYAMFCGSGEKTWTWQETETMGNGSATSGGPDWWTLNAEDMAEQCAGKNLDADGKGAYMTFVLNGMKMIKTSADGKKTEGTFMFSMQETTEPVGIGLLNLNGTNILCGHDFNDPGFAAWSEYTIISLSEDKMVLGVKEHAPNKNYWYYVFVPKE